ncbi:hypothetical protein ACRXCV_10385 [Halobacteriovorax sp. GFR7]|uniref:hypothetical protein n=1 Tax=unclassified Halobacteriovorax TaxID=2639665 RepID=UPI003D96E728
MKQHSVLRNLILNNIKENKNVFFLKTLFFFLCLLLSWIVYLKFELNILPITAFSVIMISIVLNKSRSQTIKSPYKLTGSLYNLTLPISLFHKMLLQAFGFIFSYFYSIIAGLYMTYFLLFSPDQGDMNEEKVILSTIFLFIFFVNSFNVRTFAFQERHQFNRLFRNPLVSLTNIPFLILNFIFIGISILLLGVFVSEDFAVWIIPLFLSLFIIHTFFRVYKDDRPYNEHKNFRLLQTNLKKQLILNLKLTSSFGIGAILLFYFTSSFNHINYKSYIVYSGFGFIKEAKFITLLKDKDSSKFIKYYDSGMPDDKQFEWLNEKVVFDFATRFDRKDIILHLLPSKVSEYDRFICQLYEDKKCLSGSLLKFMVTMNNQKFLTYLLKNNDYQIEDHTLSDNLLMAANECKGRSIASILDSDLIKSDKDKRDVLNTLGSSSEHECKKAMRDILNKAYLK